jgi:NodT family efflux transporter outer membrane factor (OMF) lipoprotein
MAPTWLEPALPGEVDRQWWRSFGDPQLNALVAQAIASSPDLREAEARVAEARANRDSARSGRSPQVTAQGSGTENVLSKNGQLPIASIPGFDREFSLFDIGFDASWEIDFWGRTRRQVEGADARAEAAEWARRDAMVVLLGELARNYVELRGTQADLAAARERLTAQAVLAELTVLRFRSGEANRIEAEEAGSHLAAAAAALSGLEGQAAGSAYRIAVLVGKPPEDIVPTLVASAPIPQPPAAIVSGARSALLERRPDVRRAERELAAATADVGFTTTELFPRFTLLGSLGQQARGPGDLSSSDSTRLSIGPGFSWPVFSFGRIRAQIRAADARADAAAARYEKTVLGALADSESAANRFANASRAAAEADRAAVAEAAAYRLAELRFSRGEDDRLALNRARLRVAEANQRAGDAATARAQAAVAFYKALGGGWR